MERDCIAEVRKAKIPSPADQALVCPYKRHVTEVSGQGIQKSGGRRQKSDQVK